jgi:hypothetical protein
LVEVAPLRVALSVTVIVMSFVGSQAGSGAPGGK